MNWDREIEVDWDNRVSGWMKLTDLLDWMLASVTTEEMEEFAGELMRAAHFRGFREVPLDLQI